MIMVEASLKETHWVKILSDGAFIPSSSNLFDRHTTYVPDIEKIMTKDGV